MPRFAASLLLLSACQGTDARPDEFSLEVGSGDYDGSVEGRSLDGGGEWVAVGWSWDLSAPAVQERVWEPPPAPVEAQAEPTPAVEASKLPMLATAVGAVVAGLAGWHWRAVLLAGLRWLWSWAGRALRKLRPAKRGKR